MAVVFEKTYPSGGVTRIHDDAYCNLTKAELDKRMHEVELTVGRLLHTEVTISTGEDAHGSISLDAYPRRTDCGRRDFGGVTA